ncbi:MAG: C10 family peptidase [Thermoanaerobaculales bacterium]|nr:C10 family peptidase [Thermoanaerobaculales bacterium]
MRISISAAVMCAALAAMGSTDGGASVVDRETATRVAEATIAERGDGETLATVRTIWRDGRPLLFLIDLDPAGFVVVAGNTDLPPVVAYSFADDLPSRQPEEGILVDLLRADLGLRLEGVPSLPAGVVSGRHDEWYRLLARLPREGDEPDFEQWPAAGTTSTGGWLETNWHQSSPYNDQCPFDPVAGGRSVAGCPAVAVAMVVNHHRTTNDTRFDDADDYYHSYAGRQYWIDDDWATLGFPAFPTLSASLADLEQRYRTGVPATPADAAALVFAAGVAATQVYTASISGTFGVSQAVDAYLKFGADRLSLVPGTDPEIYLRMSANMKSGLPAHLAVLDPGGSAGHNLVADGYNTDDYFHLNFGWGGSANGWYLLPDEIPYNLTVIDGVVVDIAFPLFQDGFESGTTSMWSVP